MTRTTRSLSVITMFGCALLASATVATSRAHAQTPPVVFKGRGDPEHDKLLKELLARTDQLVITRDTVVTRNDTIRTRVLVVGATLRLDGTILGDLVGVGANLFIRPSARITGETRNIAGGLYKSELSAMGPVTENSPTAQYEVVRTDSTLTIVGLEHPSWLQLPGIMGLGIPTYDRVSGLTLRAGANIVLPQIGRAEPFLRGWGEYYSHRGDFGYGAELAIERGWTEVAAGAERTTLTNEKWIRADLSNSISMLLRGKDYRNYYGADRAFVRLGRTLEKGPRISSLALSGQVEEASGLRAGRPWSFLKPDSVRPSHYGIAADGTPRFPEGRITSAIAQFNTEWELPRMVMDANALAEMGTSAFNGDHTFARFEAGGEIAMAAFKHHTLEFEAYFQGPLPGTDSLPYQRWSYVGGSGTLHTFKTAQFPGDRVAFLETVYTIPMPGIFTLPLLGRPGLDLIHEVGMAWTKDEKRGFEQNVGFRFGYRIAYLRVLTNPRDFGNPKISFGVTFPRKTYPWQAKAATEK